MNYEQVQTNLALRSLSRADVRRITKTTMLTDVDCGKFLTLALVENTSLILPNASTCIGGQIDGMVVENSGGHTLSISVGDLNGSNVEQLVGNYAGASLNVDGNTFGPHINVPVGFGFTLTSTGTKWCIRVSGLPVTTTSTPDRIGDLSFSTTIESDGQVYSTLSTETHGIKLSSGSNQTKSIVMNTNLLDCTNNIRARTIQSKPGNHLTLSCPVDHKVVVDGNLEVTGNVDVESIRGVFFETDANEASVRSGTGKDLVLSCPTEQKVIIDRNLDLHATLDLKNNDILNVGEIFANKIGGILTTTTQPHLSTIGESLNFRKLEDSSTGKMYETIFSNTNNIRIMTRPGKNILMDTEDLKCTNTVTAESFVGQIGTPTQNNIESIRDVFFETDATNAFVRSGTDKNLKLTCPSGKSVVIGNDLAFKRVIEISGEIYETIFSELVNVRIRAPSGKLVFMDTGELYCKDKVTATRFVGRIDTPTQNNIESIRDVFFETDASAASIRSGTDKDLRLTCPVNHKVVIDGNLEVNGNVNVESIQGVIFETDASAASIRSGTDKDLKLTCPVDHKVVMEGNIEVNGDLNMIGGIKFTKSETSIIMTTQGSTTNLYIQAETIRVNTGQFKTQRLEVDHINIISGFNFVDNPRVERRKYSHQSIPAFTLAAVSWPDQIGSDVPNRPINYNPGDSRFFVKQDGYYLVTWTVEFATTSSSAKLSTFLTVGNEFNRTFGKVRVPGASHPICMSSSANVFVNKDSYMTVYVDNDSQDAILIPHTIGSVFTSMYISIIRQMS